MKTIKNKKTLRRLRVHKKTRIRLSGTSSVPRLAVFRSSRYIYAQLIDDTKAKTLASVSGVGLKGTKTKCAGEAGSKLAALAKDKKISKVVFDRGGFSYAGRIKAFAEGAREGGLKF